MLKANEKSLAQAMKLFWHSLGIFNWYRQTNHLLRAVTLNYFLFLCMSSESFRLSTVELSFISYFSTRPAATAGSCQYPDAKPWNILVATSGLLVSYTGSCALSTELPLGMSCGQSIYWYSGWALSKEPFVFLLTLDM